MKKIWLFAIVLFCSVQGFAQKWNGLAKTPPMGWNSWNTFEVSISEQLVKDMVDSIVSKGLYAAGYTYIVLDDGWMTKQRDAEGNLVADPIKFPNGMKHLADYVHSKGLQFGLYNCAGTRTCADFPGSRGHEYQDARLYAKWGVDFLKYDWCNTNKLNAEEAYTTMRDAIYATGRPIMLSICEWGTFEPWKWGKNVGHFWRISGDIYPCFDCEVNHGTWSQWGVQKIVYMRNNIRKYSGPDAWNDFDMLEVGNGMNPAEDRTHFILWSMFASPLMLGNDVRTASKETVALLSNKTIIAINQDSLGIPAFVIQPKDSIDVWIKPLSNNSWAVAVVNKTSKTINYPINWHSFYVQDPDFDRKINLSEGVYYITNVFTRSKVKVKNKAIDYVIASHDTHLFIITQK